jgi:hypothetical protein
MKGAPWLFFAVMLAFALALGTLLALPDKWDRAVVIGVCGGLPILRQENGTVWLRVNSTRAYRVENPDKFCGPT